MSKEINYKFINYNRNTDGGEDGGKIELFILDNPPITLNDEVELLELIGNLKLIQKEISAMPY